MNCKRMSIRLVMLFLMSSGLACGGSGNTGILPARATNTSTAGSPTTAIWKTYTDTQWRFSIDYPIAVGERILSLIGERGQYPEGPEELLLFADSAASSLQSPGPDETIRFRVWRSLSDAMPFDEWSVAMATNFQITVVTPGMVGQCPSNSAQASLDGSQSVIARWINTGDYYLGLTIQGEQDISRLARTADSFMPEACKP